MNERAHSFLPAHVQSNQFGPFECQGSTRTESLENKLQIDLVDTLTQDLLELELGYSQISQPQLLTFWKVLLNTHETDWNRVKACKGILWRCRGSVTSGIFLSGISFTSRVNRPARAPILAALVARITTEFWVKLFLGDRCTRSWDPTTFWAPRLCEKEKSLHGFSAKEPNNCTFQSFPCYTFIFHSSIYGYCMGHTLAKQTNIISRKYRVDHCFPGKRQNTSNRRRITGSNRRRQAACFPIHGVTQSFPKPHPTLSDVDSCWSYE